MRRTGMLLVVGSVLWATSPVGAAEREAVPKLGEGRGQIILTWDEFVKITGYDPSKKGSQTLTIPWSQVEELLGVKVDKVGGGTTVDLPWQEFKALLQWSLTRDAKKKDETPPPTDYIITSTQYTASNLSEEGTDFTLTANLNILRKKGWKRIPVLPTSVAIKQAKLPEGVFLNAAGKFYELLTEKSGAMEAVAITFSVAVSKSAGVNRIDFPRVLPGSSVLDLTVARKEVDVKVAGAQSVMPVAEGDKTRVAAALPSGVPVSITWQRALPKVAAAPPKLYAETRTLVSVGDAMLLAQETVSFNILHSPVRELKLQVPAGVSVLTVTGRNMQDWRKTDKGELQVVLRNETVGSYSLRIVYEKAGGAEGAVEVPVIRAVGVEREQGFIGVVAMANVEIEAAKVTGATAIDVRQLPGEIPAMTGQPILLAFRYVGKELQIPLAIKRHREVAVLVTVVDAGLFTVMQLNDGRRITKALYTVRNNRNQFLRLGMPVAAEIWSVSVGGNTVAVAKDEAGNVLVPLVRSTRSASELDAFPVEIVYVEKPIGTVTEKGELAVNLPTCARVPVMHVMVNCYLPAEGKYEKPGGWFTESESGFSGPLRVVDEFTSLATGAGAAVVPTDDAGNAAAMQKAVDRQVDARARTAGAEPIRVKLPINGKRFKLEKILALPGDALGFRVKYTDWKVAN